MKALIYALMMVALLALSGCILVPWGGTRADGTVVVVTAAAAASVVSRTKGTAKTPGGKGLVKNRPAGKRILST